MCSWISRGSILPATGKPSSLTPFRESRASLDEDFASGFSFAGKLFPLKYVFTCLLNIPLPTHAFALRPSWHWVMVNALIAFLLNARHSDSVTRAGQMLLTCAVCPSK